MYRSVNPKYAVVPLFGSPEMAVISVAGALFGVLILAITIYAATSVAAVIEGLSVAVR